MDPGDSVRCRMTKWGDRPHWEFDGVYLGQDVHGDWIGIWPGTVFSRPGMEFSCGNHQVTLVPRAGWWTAGFHGDGERRAWDSLDGAPVDVYVDMAGPATWSDHEVTMVDLDLDVIRGTNGVVVVDDEDEFAEHRVEYGYPDAVVAAAEESCRAVLAAVTLRTAPFDGPSAQRWLDVLVSR